MNPLAVAKTATQELLEAMGIIENPPSQDEYRDTEIEVEATPPHRARSSHELENPETRTGTVPPEHRGPAFEQNDSPRLRADRDRMEEEAAAAAAEMHVSETEVEEVVVETPVARRRRRRREPPLRPPPGPVIAEHLVSQRSPQRQPHRS